MILSILTLTFIISAVLIARPGAAFAKGLLPALVIAGTLGAPVESSAQGGWHELRGAVARPISTAVPSGTALLSGSGPTFISGLDSSEATMATFISMQEVRPGLVAIGAKHTGLQFSIQDGILDWVRGVIGSLLRAAGGWFSAWKAAVRSFLRSISPSLRVEYESSSYCRTRGFMFFRAYTCEQWQSGNFHFRWGN